MPTTHPPRADRRTQSIVASTPQPAAPLVVADGTPVSIVHLTAECVPYARTGGLAEAVAGLARFQVAAGLRSAIILPLHRTARAAAADLEPIGDPFTVSLGDRHETVRLLADRSHDGPQVFLIEHSGFFDRGGIYGEGGRDYADNPERYAFFAMAALAALPRVVTGPAVLHAHDWHTALALVYLRTAFRNHPAYQGISTVLSVHNAGYQGYFRPELMPRLGLPWSLFNWRQLEWHGQVNLLKGGLVFADAAVTVSPNHAQELRTENGGFGLHHVFRWMGTRFSGILNGIDQREWDPSADQEIAARFDLEHLEPKAHCKQALQTMFGLDPEPSRPLFGMAARLVTQKGLDLVLGQPSLFDLPAQFIFLGAGEPRFERALVHIASRAPHRIAVRKFEDTLEHHLMAGADLCLMPCQYEPCGLTQMRSQRYGTLPLVRSIGGLADTVDDCITGFAFQEFHAEPLFGAALRALDRFAAPDEWNRMRRNAMTRDFSWERSVEEYLSVYRRVVSGAVRAPEAS